MSEEEKAQKITTFEEIITLLAASIMGKFNLENEQEVMDREVGSFFISLRLPTEGEEQDGMIQFAGFSEHGDDPHLQAIVDLIQALAQKFNTDARSVLNKIIANVE